MNENQTFYEDLQRDVDADHRRIDGAAAPPADMWKSIRAQVKPETIEEEKAEMINSNALSQAPVPVTRPADQREGGVRHTLSLAASFLIVMSVALGGWFATMQLNQPGGSNGQFALFGQTDEATCEAEPMTVDEVMNIVENPYRYMDESDYPNPLGSTDQEFPWMDDYREVYPRLGSSIGTVFGDEPTKTAFDEASAVISHYIACLQEDGTVAMMLRFADPFSIQHHIRVEFPFYRSEEQVREYVAGWLQSGEQYHALSFERQGEMLTFQQSDQKSGASTQIHNFGMGFDQIIYIGSEVYDDSGEFIGHYHPVVRQPSGESLNYGLLFTLIHSQYTNEWYVVTDGRWLTTGDI